MKIFIISYNRFDFLKQQVEFFKQNPELDIHIIDNGSTYQPLVDYLDNVQDVHIHFCGQNYGHKVIWYIGFSRQYSQDEPYIVTDPDIIPEDENFVDMLLEALEKFPEINKIGLGLRTDDLPEHYPLREKVIQHEEFILASEGYFMRDTRFIKAPVDTTLAIYRAGCHEYFIKPALRTTQSLAKHLSWYMTAEEMQNEENTFYHNSMKDGSTHWSYMQASSFKPKRKRR